MKRIIKRFLEEEEEEDQEEEEEEEEEKEKEEELCFHPSLGGGPDAR